MKQNPSDGRKSFFLRTNQLLASIGILLALAWGFGQIQATSQEVKTAMQVSRWLRACRKKTRDMSGHFGIYSMKLGLAGYSCYPPENEHRHVEKPPFIDDFGKTDAVFHIGYCKRWRVTRWISKRSRARAAKPTMKSLGKVKHRNR